MASIKNSRGQYCLEQRKFKVQDHYIHYKNRIVPETSKVPGLGINMGNMFGGYFNNVLSNNTVDIESNLYGIRQIDLTTPKKSFYANLNTMCEETFFETPKVFVPEPLVVHKQQRPTGPFSGN
jgi:hypothetical protein